MNIPEGWKLVPVVPTQEMHDARYRLGGDNHSPQERWEAMLAAAPTPPLTQHLEEQPDGSVHPVDPTDMDKESHKAFSRPILYTDTLRGEQVGRDDMWAITTSELKDILAAPTPPAPEVEPVAWRRTERDICDEYCTVYYDEETAPAGKGWEPLYTHPANDGLRKAAEDAFEVLDGVRTDYIDVKNNLRAELNKDKS